MSGLVTAAEIARLWDVHPSTVRKWAQKGLIPVTPCGRQKRFDLADVERTLRLRAKDSASPGKRCTACGARKGADSFLIIADKRPGRRSRLSSDCRECRKEQRRQWRARKAEEAGRTYRTRAAWDEEIRVREAERNLKREAVRAAKRRSRDASRKRRIARNIKRQRERYNSDPDYQSRVKARKIRRKRARAGTQIVPVNRQSVAERDGWICGICRRKVTRRDWSLDHVIPLSQGGAHTYENVVIAHQRCNSARGAGRLPVQPSLLPLIERGEP